ncbi:hypothetical protein J7U46_15740 [Pelomonas sp. V22]|uniref:hypothetical protein n=1 Tax=Pelomonas sp. V22 TaxID=2822139 RepID=UPI0024A95A55|nr:hypothetical protein [Pelomonas sp. V22]MDI4634512.1 hypothetical protein [Pelomonas sp. V22]
MTLDRRSLLLAAGALASGASGAAPDSNPALVIRVAKHEAMQDPQIRYVLLLLRLALERSGQKIEIQSSRNVMVQSRALLELARPEPSLDVFWTMTNPEREQQLLPVRIPLDRGLLGWRLLLVRKAELERWAGVHTLEQLAVLQAGQMNDWPDTAILRANGLRVQTGTHFESLFGWLAEGRFDYFPRSVLEIGLEALEHGPQGLVIEPHLMLQYPAALYFFVAPAKPQLHEQLSHGMEALVADGSLERLWQAQFGDIVERYQLRARRLLKLSNPLMPTNAPLARKNLWFGI